FRRAGGRRGGQTEADGEGETYECHWILRAADSNGREPDTTATLRCARVPAEAVISAAAPPAPARAAARCTPPPRRCGGTARGCRDRRRSARSGPGPCTRTCAGRA